MNHELLIQYKPTPRTQRLRDSTVSKTSATIFRTVCRGFKQTVLAMLMGSGRATDRSAANRSCSTFQRLL